VLLPFPAAFRTFGSVLPVLLCAIVLVAGCDAHYPINAPIKSQDVTKGYRVWNDGGAARRDGPDGRP
jgi:hypothetical protein